MPVAVRPMPCERTRETCPADSNRQSWMAARTRPPKRPARNRNALPGAGAAPASASFSLFQRKNRTVRANVQMEAMRPRTNADHCFGNRETRPEITASMIAQQKRNSRTCPKRLHRRNGGRKVTHGGCYGWERRMSSKSGGTRRPYGRLVCASFRYACLGERGLASARHGEPRESSAAIHAFRSRRSVARDR